MIALASVPVHAQWHYYYFDEPKALTIDPSRVAVRDAVGGVASNVTGVDESQIEPISIRGWSVVHFEGGIATDIDIEQRVAALAETAGFASPVFVDDYGGPLIVTPDILVGFHDDVDPIIAERILQDVDAGTIVERRFGNLDRTYRVSSASRNGFEVLEKANALARRAEVRFAEPDMIFTGYGALVPSDPLFSDAWGLHNTGQFGGTPGMDMSAVEAWDVTTGTPSVFVVIIDCGVQQDHPDILQRSPGLDTTNDARCVGGDNPGDLCKTEDDCTNGGACPMFTDGGPVNRFDDHGTAVAGCVSGKMNNGIGAVGIAPHCRTTSARTFITINATGEWISQPRWTVDTLAWAESLNAEVTNNSNCYAFSSSSIAAKYADTRANGMVHFASSCNDGGSTLGYPSRLDSVNAIGALDSTGNRASFSNTGNGLAFSAPGVDVITTDRTGLEGYDSGDYAFVQGTSFASPYAAGVAALLMSEDPGLDAAMVEQVLIESAVDIGAPGYDIVTGWGFINAGRALEWDTACAFPPSPTLETTPIAKNRYLSFIPPRSVGSAALRLTAVDLPGSYGAFNGASWWITEPVLHQGNNTPPTAYQASTLACTQAFVEWGSIETLYVYGAQIVPGATYAIETFLNGCNSTVGFTAYYSTPLAITSNVVWGDIAPPFASDTTAIQPDFKDISAVIAAFVSNNPMAPSVPVADLHPAVPNGVVDFNDIATCVATFVGDPYSFDGPTVCP